VRATPPGVPGSDSGRWRRGTRLSPAWTRRGGGDDGWDLAINLSGAGNGGERAGGLAGPADGPLHAELLRGLSRYGLLLRRVGLLHGWRCGPEMGWQCWAAELDGVG
jgi:hypothetical protein